MKGSFSQQPHLITLKLKGGVIPVGPQYYVPAPFHVGYALFSIRPFLSQTVKPAFLGLKFDSLNLLWLIHTILHLVLKYRLMDE